MNKNNSIIAIYPSHTAAENDGKSYVPPFELGKPLDGVPVPEVLTKKGIIPGING